MESNQSNPIDRSLEAHPALAHALSEDDLIQLSLLRDEETDELIDAGLLDSELHLSSPLDSQLCFTHEELVLQITAGIHYPVVTPKFEVINLSMSRKDVDCLRGQLREAAEKAAQTNNFERWLDRENSPYSIFEATKLVLEMAEATSTFVSEARARKLGVTGTAAALTEPWERKKPVETLSTSALALRYLGKTAKEICDTIPGDYRVLHAEQVIRRDLATRFDHYQRTLRRDLLNLGKSLKQFVPRDLQRSSTEEVVEHLVRPRLTFHGTQRHFVPSIVQHGFIKPGNILPGTAGKLGVRCGASYGTGIYSSPSAEFSLAYSNWYGTATKPDEFFGLELIVCATIMGRPRMMFREDNWREQSKPYEGADSHVGNRELEYIVFNSAQILPVYVLHIDWGDDNKFHYMDIPLDPEDWTPSASRPKKKMEASEGLNSQFAGDRQRARQAVFAKAAKHFPYGYGPATGGRFIVEDVGEVSEDEEDYGDYQALRVEQDKITTSASTDFWGWVKAADEDEAREHGENPDEYIKYTGSRPENWDDIVPADRQEGVITEDADLHLEWLLGREPEES